MSEPTPRQVLYALVSGGFVAVVAVLVIGAAVAGLVPAWWTSTMTGLVTLGVLVVALRWRRTGMVLAIGVGLMVVWTVGTILTAS